MLRAILAIVISYVVMFVLAFIAFACAFLILSPEVVFKPGVYEASPTWIGVAFVINIVDALIGGLICALIAKGGKAPFALAVVVIFLGLVVAFADKNKWEMNAGLARLANAPQLEAIQKAYWPVWVPFAFPLTGAMGVLIGARLKRFDAMY
jgi:hypothetical protein